MSTQSLIRRRRELEERIAEMIDLLDFLDGDVDLEDDGTAEPSLGSPEVANGAQIQWARGNTDEREQENEHGGDILDEPHDAIDEGNDEPSLGWSNPMGVRVEDMPRGWSSTDSEGWARDDLIGGTTYLDFTGEGHVAAYRELQELRRQGRVTEWMIADARPAVGLAEPGPLFLRIAR